MQSMAGGVLLKKSLKTIAFSYDLIYIKSYRRFGDALGSLGISGFSLYFPEIHLKKQKHLTKKIGFFRGFLSIRSSFLEKLNLLLPFQYRNKMGFLCAI
jgi:hypothetical protein